MPLTVQKLLRSNRDDLLALDIEGAWKVVLSVKSPAQRYDGSIAILVAMRLQHSKCHFTVTNIRKRLGKPTMALGSKRLAHDIFKHQSRDHAIMVDYRNGIYVGFGTGLFSHFAAVLTPSARDA